MASKRKYDESPKLARALIIGDDPRLLARFSSILAQKRTYLPVVDGPRLTRPDADAEVIRRNNIAAIINPSAIIYANLNEDARKRFAPYFPTRKTHVVSTVEDLRTTAHRLPMRDGIKLEWGKDQIGIGLLKALYAGAEVEFIDKASPKEFIASPSGHLVICEEGNDLGQVIAANYAYSSDAGLLLIPEVPDEKVTELLELFYGSQENRQQSSAQTLTYLRDTLRALAGEIPLKNCTMLTFVTHKLPWGYAFPEIPSTHLFLYPDCGQQIVRGIVAEQEGTPGIRTAVLVNPAVEDAGDIVAARECFKEKGAFIMGYRGGGATVHRVSLMAELYPYDFLMIATHCGDVPGIRWEFDFTDSEGIERSMVVDVAIGVAQRPPDGLRPPSEEEKLGVTAMYRFVSLDGVDWNDPKKKEKLHIGTAVWDFFERVKNLDKNRPKTKTPIERVHGSAALKMFDHNLMLTPHSLADNGSPIILNNACVSWHELASKCTFAGARAYIGTLFSVIDAEVLAVTETLMGNQFGKSLAVALWHAQNKVYNASGRHPYILVGVHFQKLRVTRSGTPKLIFIRLLNSLKYWAKFLRGTDPKDEFRTSAALDRLRFLKENMEGIKSRWL